MTKILTVYIIFAIIFPLQKETLHYSEQFFTISVRMVFSGIILLSFIKIYKNIEYKKIKKDIGLFIKLSISNIFITNTLEIWALNQISASKTCILYSLSPFFSAIIENILVKGTNINTNKKIGLIIGFLGILPLIIYKTNSEECNIFIFSYTEIALITSIITNIYGWIILKKLTNLKHSVILSNSISMIIGGLFILIYSMVIGERWELIPIKNNNSFLTYSIITMILSNIIAYNLFGQLLKTYSTTFLIFCGLSTPIICSFLNYIIAKETISSNFIISIALFFIGLYIYYNEETKKL